MVTKNLFKITVYMVLNMLFGLSKPLFGIFVLSFLAKDSANERM